MGGLVESPSAGVLLGRAWCTVMVTESSYSSMATIQGGGIVKLGFDLTDCGSMNMLNHKLSIA